MALAGLATLKLSGRVLLTWRAMHVGCTGGLDRIWEGIVIGCLLLCGNQGGVLDRERIGLVHRTDLPDYQVQYYAHVACMLYTGPESPSCVLYLSLHRRRECASLNTGRPGAATPCVPCRSHQDRCGHPVRSHRSPCEVRGCVSRWADFL